MTPQEKARQLRPLLEKATSILTDEEALQAKELFYKWDIGIECKAGFRYLYKDNLYRVNEGMTHTSQSDWTPDITPAMFTKVGLPGEILAWKQPAGAHDAYQKGNKVYYPNVGDTIYICTADNNVYSPGVYGWEIYKEN